MGYDEWKVLLSHSAVRLNLSYRIVCVLLTAAVTVTVSSVTGSFVVEESADDDHPDVLYRWYSNNTASEAD